VENFVSESTNAPKGTQQKAILYSYRIAQGEVSNWAIIRRLFVQLNPTETASESTHKVASMVEN
jgi:hypothetical protein